MLISWWGRRANKFDIFVQISVAAFGGPLRTPDLNDHLLHTHTHTHTAARQNDLNGFAFQASSPVMENIAYAGSFTSKLHWGELLLALTWFGDLRRLLCADHVGAERRGAGAGSLADAVNCSRCCRWHFNLEPRGGWLTTQNWAQREMEWVKEKKIDREREKEREKSDKERVKER